MKLTIFFYMSILLLPITLAETQIFSGNIITDTDKLIDGSTFRFKYDEKSDKVFVDMQPRSLIIENGQCKSNNVFKVCINRANFSYRNITTWVYYYEIDATISKLTGSLSTTSKAKSDTLLQGESTELAVTITNPTDFDMTSVVYKEDLTPFIIKDVKSCSLDGNQIVWQGSLKSNYYQTCTATITAEKEGTHTLAGNLSYFNGFETEKKTTDAVVVNVLPKQVKVSLVIDDYTEIDQPFYANISIQNINKDEKIEVYMTIELPNNAVLLKEVQGFTKDSNILKLNAILEPDSIKNHSLYLQALSEGKTPIKLKLDYLTTNVWDIIENNTIIDIIEPKPIVNFSAEYNELEAGQKFIVIAMIKNPSRIRELTDIKATLNAPNNNEIEQSINKLIPNETYSIISNTLITPKKTDLGPEEENNTIKLNLSIEYKFLGVTKLLNKFLELKVVPSNYTMANVTSIESYVQPPQERGLNDTFAVSHSDNKTGGEITTTKKTKSSLLNKIFKIFSFRKKTPQQPQSEQAQLEQPQSEQAQSEKPKPLLFEGVMLFLGILTSIVIITFFINYRRKKRKKDNNELQKTDLKDDSETLNKPKTF